jgi:hypothetical protein
MNTRVDHMTAESLSDPIAFHARALLGHLGERAA